MREAPPLSWPASLLPGHFALTLFSSRKLWTVYLTEFLLPLGEPEDDCLSSNSFVPHPVMPDQCTRCLVAGGQKPASMRLPLDSLSLRPDWASNPGVSNSLQLM